MPDYRPPLGNPKAREVVCFSDLTRPHGEGHNRVCLCQCQWCKRERDLIVTGPEQPDLFTAS